MTDTDKFITPYLSRQHPEEITYVQEYSALGKQLLIRPLFYSISIEIKVATGLKTEYNLTLRLSN